MVISQLAGSRHITWTKPCPEPKAWAGFGFWWPKARAWILLGLAQAEPGQAEPAHHYSGYFTCPMGEEIFLLCEYLNNLAIIRSANDSIF